MADYLYDGYGHRNSYQRKKYKQYGSGAGIIGNGGQGNIHGTGTAVGAGTGIAPIPNTITPKIADVEFEVHIVSVDSGYPHGLYCADCGNQFIDGDVVLAGQQRLVGWVGWHTRCLKGILEECPLDEYETIKQKIDNGEDPFE